MGSSMLVLVAVLCCLHAAQTFSMLLFCNNSSDNEIVVYSRAAQCSCELTGNVSEYSLSRLDKVLGNCTTVYFCSPVFELDESLSFVNLHHVSFVGCKRTTFDCNGVNGIHFTHVTNLRVQNMNFINCAQSSKLSLRYRGNNTFEFMSGLQTLNCTHVQFISTTISHSSGVGLTLISTGGDILFRQCSFEFNGKNKVRGGSGLVIEISTYHGTYWDITNALYSLTNCTFSGNYAYEREVKSTPFGRGGGVRLYIRDASANNRVVFNLCIFHNNTASRWGGALFASIHDVATNNSVVVKDSIFTQNQSPLGYGGAAYVGFQCGDRTLQCLSNSYLFNSCSFLQNLARFGGGSVFTSTRIYDSNGQYNQMKYLNCTWSENLALYGSAVAILPDTWSLLDVGSFPTPVFEDSTVTTNYIISNDKPLQTPYEQYSMGFGGVYCTLYTIVFRKKLLLDYNNGSAIVGNSCFLSFQEGSVISFHHNTGYSGGAMHLLGYSTIYVHQNCSFTFTNNTADTNGGAIYYHSSDLLEHDYSYNCFIARDEGATSSSISFVFSQNQAGLGNSDVGYGTSIYSTSLLPCLREYYTLNSSKNNSYLSKLANFTFTDDNKYDLTTEVGSFSTEHIKRPMKYVPIIPGKYTVLEFQGLDDLNHTRNSVYQLIVKNDAYSSVKTYNENSYVTNNSVRLLGNPGDTATLELATITQRKTVLSFRVELQPCPPGYIQHELSNYSNTCVCSSDTDSPYYGIESCDIFKFRAHRTRGYWYGYQKNKSLSDPLAFMTGSCPKGFCAFKSHNLPDRASRKALTECVCNPSRKGLLCSHCKHNKTTHYHSPNFKCGNQDLCHLGVLFYFASDIVPATLLFVVILAWDISFTSGGMNGFILYAQVIGFFQLSAHNRVVQTQGVGSVLSVFQMSYDIFNLQFFNHDKLSFCLFRHTDALDVVLIQFVTLLYSFLLVLFIVLTLKVCNIRCLKLLFKCRIHKIQTSMIHGLSAFLVLCFARCAKLAMSTLWAGFIYGRNGSRVKTVVYLHAGIYWLSTRHLKYMMPALMVAFVLVVIPLLVLLVYPLSYRCLGLMKLSNTRAIVICHKLLPFEKMKPFLDSFQGGYKDSCRFFSGVYFLYRILILLNMAVADLRIFYFVLELQLILMLLINGIAQPYKKVKHNVIDSLLFANMALINAISMYRFSISHYQHGLSRHANVESSVQVMLVGVPMLCIVLYSAYCFIRLLFAKCSRRVSRWTEVNRQSGDLLQYCDLASSRSDPAEESSITQSFATNSYNTFDY